MEERKIQAIRAFTNDLITKTTQTLNVSPEIAFLLLDHFQWDLEKLNSQWESSQEEVLKSIHIQLGSTAVPTLESNLLPRDCGVGPCPACHRDRRLVELYCGHKICNDCLTEEIKKALAENTIPRCHQDDCNTEILGNAVEKYVPHNNAAKVYKFWRINTSFESTHLTVAICPNPLCKHLITLGEGVAHDHVKCPKCDFAICLKCLSDSHPLHNCERVINFTETLPKEFNQILEEEQKWYKREKDCIECRTESQNDVKQAFNIDIKVLLREQQNEQKEIAQQIKNTDLFVQAILTEISQLDDKIKQYEEKKRSPQRIEELKKQIDSLNDEIEHYKAFKTQLQKDNEARKEQRKKELAFIDSQNKLFLSACTDRNKYDEIIKQYRDNWEQYAQEKATAVLDEEDYIRQNTVICPACSSRFYKDCGCNEVVCTCGHDFCTICNEPWVTHEKGFYYCPNNELSNKKFDYEDSNDVRFFSNPMNLQKKVHYHKWKHFHDLFLTQKAKYDEIFKKYLLGKDMKPQKDQSLTDDDLCPFTKLARHLEQENSEEGRNDALKLVSNVLYAQSLIAYGTAALYYINVTEFTQEYTEKLQNLEKKEDELVQLLDEPVSHQPQEFQDKLTELKGEVENILSIKL